MRMEGERGTPDTEKIVEEKWYYPRNVLKISNLVDFFPNAQHFTADFLNLFRFPADFEEAMKFSLILI